MKRSFFAERVLRQLTDRLRDDEVPLKRITAVSKDALEVMRDHGEDIPNEAVLDYLKAHPEVEGELLMILEREDRETREATVDEIRKLIGQKRS